MSPPSSLRYRIAWLIVGLLPLAAACEAEPAPADPVATEPAIGATRAPTATAAPTGIPAGEVRDLRLSSPARGLLRIRWSQAAPSPTDYHVNWARLSEDFPPLTDDAGNAYPSVASHVITGLEAGTMYKVRVRARHQDGSDEDSIRTGPWSATEAVRVIAPPFAPTGLTAVATHRGVVLEWDDPGDDTITSYELVRAFEDRFGASHVVQTGSAETQYVDTDVLHDLGYVYTLHAVNSFGKGQASEAVSVTTLARIPGRDYLYEQISPPMAPAYANWYWERGHDRLREVILDFTIHNDVGDWSDTNSYYLILMQNDISGERFYFGLQSEVDHPDNPLGQTKRGKGAIFSRWGTRDLAYARAAPTDGWTQSSGHEGDFIGVRREYDWGAGDYRARIAPDGLEDDGEWFSFWITDMGTNVTTWIGSLKFPLVGGSATMDGLVPVTLELVGRPIAPIAAPEWYVTIEPPRGDGVLPARVVTDYPYDHSSNAMLNSNVTFDPAGQTLHLRIGGTTERSDPAAEYTLR